MHSVVLGMKNEVVELLIKDGHIDVNARHNSGLTPMHYAIKESKFSIVRLLIEVERIISMYETCTV